ncbi:hypothetical protein JI667_06650 [Bacillus sp. NTK074B]|uniref:hypothetical protein n=1 Tax=Bacillus sp. NTK074B TaxID=2802174 RepID=UPI001A8BFF94|nr:hypothetical protein [Bacillus sp. NTK074B]
MKQFSLNNVSQIFLGVCIVAGAWMISDAIYENGSQKTNERVSVSMNTTEQPQLMNGLELKRYLGINDEQLNMIYPRKEDGVVTSNIPYIELGYEYYFPVKAIDRWLADMEVETFRDKRD